MSHCVYSQRLHLLDVEGEVRRKENSQLLLSSWHLASAEPTHMRGKRVSLFSYWLVKKVDDSPTILFMYFISNKIILLLQEVLIMVWTLVSNGESRSLLKFSWDEYLNLFYLFILNVC